MDTITRIQLDIMLLRLRLGLLERRLRAVR